MDSPLFKKWAEKCNFDEQFIANSSLLFLCDKHFSSELIGKKFLRRGAVPSLYLTENNEDMSVEGIEVYSENDLQLFRSPPQTRRGSKSPSPLCTNCEKNVKNEALYRKKYYNIIKKLNTKMLTIRDLRSKNESLKKRVTVMEKKLQLKKSIESEIDELHINPHEKTLCKMLIKQNRKSNARWEDQERNLAESIYYRSTSTYLFLRNTLKLNLPSLSSLSRWSDIKNLQPGNNLCIYNALEAAVRKMQHAEKQCILIFDEVSIRRNFTYNNSADVIDGVVDLGYERKNEVGTQICVFMLRGILKNWKFLLNYVVTATSVKGDILKQLLLSNLDIVTKIGLNVRAVTCDQGPNNRKCYELLGASSEKPYFSYNSNNIYLLYDVPHIFKSIRNAFLKADFKTPDGIARFDVIREIFELEHGKTTKMTKLTVSHINPTNFEKMRVNIAVQTLSHSVAAAIHSANENRQFTRNTVEAAASTCAFIKKLNKYFDCLNSKVFKDPNPLRSGLQRNNKVWETLKDLLSYISQVSYLGSKIFSINGLIQTTRGIMSLSEEMFQEDDMLFILTSHFNQDPLENLFSYLRAKGGHCKNPSVHEFNITMAKLLSLKITQFNTLSNCEKDDAVMLPINFQTILEDLSKDASISGCQQTSAENALNIYEGNEEYFDENSDSFNSVTVPIELTSSRYFAGYIAQRISCQKCRLDIIKPTQILTYPSEMYIHAKNYNEESDFGSLCGPSDLFFEICKIQIKVFEKIFTEDKSIRNIKKTIVEQCIQCTKNTTYSFWYEENDVCYKHRLEMLNLLVLTLLRKHSSWQTQNYKSSSAEKVKILTH